MFIATIPAVLWIDRVGRKPVLTVGAIGMGTCHIIIAIILAKNIDNFHNAPAAGWAAVCMVWLFVIHFGCKRLSGGTPALDRVANTMAIQILGDHVLGSLLPKSGR